MTDQHQNALNTFNIPIHVEDHAQIHRTAEAIRIGVSLPRALVRTTNDIVVTDAAGGPIPFHGAPLAFWPDRSLKWLLLDALTDVPAGQRVSIAVQPRASVGEASPAASLIRVIPSDRGIEVDTGSARFEILKNHGGPIASVRIGQVSVLDSPGSRFQLVAENHRVYEPVVDRLAVEEEGPIRATVVTEGWFHGSRGAIPIRFKFRAVFVAGSSSVQLECQIRNTRAAVHPGGRWDLGDPGSWFFKDLTLSIHPNGQANSLRWYAESPAEVHEHPAGAWSIYQDSSGGERWDSPNHVDHRSQSTVAFRGYRVNGGTDNRSVPIAEGHRAVPGVMVVCADSWIAATVKDFWQNFPKALRWKDGVLSVGLFPGEARGGFELQGGEQKRHTILLDFGNPSQPSCLSQLQHPASVCVDPAWTETSRAIPWLTAQSDSEDIRYRDYVGGIVKGPQSFVARREIADEYGWRNFGELYADHEAIHHRGEQPFISHYNNQYDFVYGAFAQLHRTGDVRWRQLLDDAARHLIDIDIYHTHGDKAAFNGGLFWHTDHYLPASTCTHRTYSRSNGKSGYGGGPSSEHNYTSGLLHYYYLTGDREAAAALQELAEWVSGMDDGSRTIWGIADASPTGGASRTLDSSYHRPGRGAGNSINALLDAYALSRERKYLVQAEALIERCINPLDDVANLRLDDPERRWSYLVFLQVLSKYLLTKTEAAETDYPFHFARESLLHYAEWMVEHEVPYKEVLHRVEIPTETWPAHDIRKCHVLHAAAAYATGTQRDRFREKARFFYERCLTDLLEFKTAHLTRPLVILCVYGWIHEYFCKYGTSATSESFVHNYRFDPPSTFLPQRARVQQAVVFKLRVVAAELTRIVTNVWYDLRSGMRV